MTSRGQGDYFERATRAALELLGWVTIRSAGSFGPADVWAARAGQLLLISCKVDGNMRPGERTDLLAAAKQAGGLPVMSYRTEPRGWLSLAIVDGTPTPPQWDTLRIPPRPKAKAQTEDRGPPPSGDQLKQQGMTQALAAVPTWNTLARPVLLDFAASPEPFTSEDVVAKVGLPRGTPGRDRNNAVGALFGAAARQGLICKVGRRKATRALLHSAELTIWMGTQHMHRCEHCGYSFPTKEDLRRHQEERGGCPSAP